MRKGGHYNTSKLVEAQFELGSHGRVLKNLLGIKSKREMDRMEAQEHLRALAELIKIFDQSPFLMALQAGLPPLDFGALKGPKRKEYFTAVRAGLDENYRPMEKVFDSVIRRTLRISGRG